MLQPLYESYNHSNERRAPVRQRWGFWVIIAIIWFLSFMYYLNRISFEEAEMFTNQNFAVVVGQLWWYDATMIFEFLRNLSKLSFLWALLYSYVADADKLTISSPRPKNIKFTSMVAMV